VLILRIWLRQGHMQGPTFGALWGSAAAPYGAGLIGTVLGRWRTATFEEGSDQRHQILGRLCLEPTVGQRKGERKLPEGPATAADDSSGRRRRPLARGEMPFPRA
jgi:hypothetical protein